MSAAIRVEHGVDRLTVEREDEFRSYPDGVAGDADEVDRHAIHGPVDLTVGRRAQIEALIGVPAEVGERVGAGQDRLHSRESVHRGGIKVGQVSLGKQ